MNRFGLIAAFKYGAMSVVTGLVVLLMVAKASGDRDVVALVALFWVVATVLVALITYDEEVSQRGNFE
jgi:hypothetical protein